MVPYVSAPMNDQWGATAPPQTYATLPPSQSAEPWGGGTVYSAPPAATNGYGYGAPPPGPDPFGTPASLPALSATSYGAPPPSQDPFHAQAPVPHAYGAPSPLDSYGAPAPQANPYGAPPTPQFQQQQAMYAQPPPVQPSVPQQEQLSQPPQPDPFGTPAPYTVTTGFDYTPASTIGFASPVAQNAPEPVPMPAPAPEPAQQWTDPALLSMGTLSGQAPSLVSQNESKSDGGTLADQAYAKLVNMDAFDLVKDKSERKNPFEFGAASVGSNTMSLADMKKSTSVSSRFYRPLIGCKTVSVNHHSHPFFVFLTGTAEENNYELDSRRRCHGCFWQPTRKLWRIRRPARHGSTTTTHGSATHPGIRTASHATTASVWTTARASAATRIRTTTHATTATIRNATHAATTAATYGGIWATSRAAAAIWITDHDGPASVRTATHAATTAIWTSSLGRNVSHHCFCRTLLLPVDMLGINTYVGRYDSP
jgi:hypothetical protein